MLAAECIFIIWIVAYEIANIYGQGDVFDLMPIQLTGVGTKIEAIEKKNSIIGCIVFCKSKTACQSVSFCKDTGICYINHVTLTSPGVIPQHQTEYIFTETPIRNGEGTLVFRAKAGLGLSVFESWSDEGHDDSSQITSRSIGCMTVNNLLPCNKHFRSWRLDNWINISKVKFALYTDSQPVFFVTFDARNTIHRNEPFKMSRIINSSASQLVGYGGSYNFDDTIGNEFDACTGDKAWLMVNDGRAHARYCCPYDHIEPHPSFLYTKKARSVNFHNPDDSGRAQVFAVFVTYN